MVPDNSAGFNLSIPLRLFDRNQGNKETAKYVAQASRFTELAVRNQVVADVDEAWIGYVNAKVLSDRYNGHYLDEAKDVLDISKFSYEHGASGVDRLSRCPTGVARCYIGRAKCLLADLDGYSSTQLCFCDGSCALDPGGETRTVFRGVTTGTQSLLISQNGNCVKINPESVACFSTSKSDHQNTTITAQFTTNSPSKYHVFPPFFSKTPGKHNKPPPQKKHPRNPTPNSYRQRPKSLPAARSSVR